MFLVLRPLLGQTVWISLAVCICGAGRPQAILGQGIADAPILLISGIPGASTSFLPSARLCSAPVDILVCDHQLCVSVQLCCHYPAHPGQGSSFLSVENHSPCHSRYRSCLHDFDRIMESCRPPVLVSCRIADSSADAAQPLLPGFRWIFRRAAHPVHSVAGRLACFGNRSSPRLQLSGIPSLSSCSVDLYRPHWLCWTGSAQEKEIPQ